MHREGVNIIYTIDGWVRSCTCRMSESVNIVLSLMETIVSIVFVVAMLVLWFLHVCGCAGAREERGGAQERNSESRYVCGCV